MTMTRGWLGLAVGVVIATAACRGSAPAPRRALTVALPPGRIDDFNAVIAGPFERESGVHLEVVGLRSADQVARLRIERDRPSFDILWVDQSEALLLAREGLLKSVTEKQAPNLAKVRPEVRGSSALAPPTFAAALGFLYNTKRLPQPPRSWAALWDPHLRHELALFEFSHSLGPMMLVMAAHVAGGGVDNIEPGFARMLALLPNVQSFGTSGPANNNLVAQGEAGLTLGLANQARDLRATGAPVEWIVPAEGALALPQGFQIAAGTSQETTAYQLLDFVFRTDTQGRLTNTLLLVASNGEVVPSPDVAPLVPQRNIIYFDFEKIGEKRAEWTNRFNREIATRR